MSVNKGFRTTKQFFSTIPKFKFICYETQSESKQKIVFLGTLLIVSCLICTSRDLRLVSHVYEDTI